MVPFRVGQAMTHRFEEGRELGLGEENRSYLWAERSPDADVLLHKLYVMPAKKTSALRDIGYHFPDTDPRYKGADSMLLHEVGSW